MPKDMRGEKWTRLDEEQIVRQLKLGTDLKDIAAMLGRTENAVLIRMELLARTRLQFDKLKAAILGTGA